MKIRGSDIRDIMFSVLSSLKNRQGMAAESHKNATRFPPTGSEMPVGNEVRDDFTALYQAWMYRVHAQMALYLNGCLMDFDAAQSSESPLENELQTANRTYDTESQRLKEKYPELRGMVEGFFD
ncbi:MAG: hypothetical protein ABH879_04980 [archaeon]